jgi:phage anti-repressor protein
VGEQNLNEEKRGAHNKQYITVSPDCFKELCMHVGTKKSKEIKKYYIKLEKVFKLNI